MWPFKKKFEQKNITKSFTTVICIPGNWENWNEFITSIVSATEGEYIAAANVLINTKKHKHYTVEFCERDERMKESFRYAGSVTNVTEDFLDEIGNHKHVIYISGPTGSLSEAEHISFAAEAILKAGGLGIKIETAGKAFEKNIWLEFLDTFEQSDLYKMFVIDSIIDENGTVYSCGMQNLGYKDTITSGEEFQYAVSLISLFNYYQIVDKPIIQNNQTFTPDLESPKFRITDESQQPNIGDELFENPYGMWRLTKM